MARLFGTDGVRGVVNEFLTPKLAYYLSHEAATYSLLCIISHYIHHIYILYRYTILQYQNEPIL